MKKLKLTIVMPLLAVLFIATSCSDNGENPLDQSLVDFKSVGDGSTEASNLDQIKGKVQDAETGKGMADVTVMLLPSREETTTNVDGEYILELAKTDTLITFSQADFQGSVNLSRKKYSVVNVALRETGND